MSRRRVLVVDDDVNLSRLAGMILENSGRYEVMIVNEIRPRSGAAASQQNPPRPRRRLPAPNDAGPYPAHVYGPGYSERSIEDYWFKDDPRINDKELKNAGEGSDHPFVVIVDLKRGSDGVWRGERDITLKAVKGSPDAPRK